tara:strand:- start:70 stop:780 length:711 start_codon:yes stop_codon:yes gene_type:complete
MPEGNPAGYLDYESASGVDRKTIPLDAQGNKTDPMGRAIDNFLRGIIPGSLPQAPPQVQIGNGAPTPALGIQAPNYGDIEGGAMPQAMNLTGDPVSIDAGLLPAGSQQMPVSVDAGNVGGIPAGTSAMGPGEFEPDAIGADVFEDPNSFDPFSGVPMPPAAAQPVQQVVDNVGNPVSPMTQRNTEPNIPVTPNQPAPPTGSISDQNFQNPLAQWILQALSNLSTEGKFDYLRDRTI